MARRPSGSTLPRSATATLRGVPPGIGSSRTPGVQPNSPRRRAARPCGAGSPRAWLGWAGNWDVVSIPAQAVCARSESWVLQRGRLVPNWGTVPFATRAVANRGACSVASSLRQLPRAPVSREKARAALPLVAIPKSHVVCLLFPPRRWCRAVRGAEGAERPCRCRAEFGPLGRKRVVGVFVDWGEHAGARSARSKATVRTRCLVRDGGRKGLREKRSAHGPCGTALRRRGA